MSLVFLNSARQALLLDRWMLAALQRQCRVWISAFTYVATGAVRVVHHLFDDCFYTTR